MNRNSSIVGMVCVLGILSLMVFGLLAACEELPEQMGCTLVGCTGSVAANDEIFFGSTMDNAWWPTRHTVWVVQPENGYKYIGTKAAIWGLGTGMNEKGFGYTGAAVSSTEEQDPEADITMFNLGPILLESCATVPEAIEALKKMKFGKDFWTRNWILGDAEGNIALVEISYRTMNVETLTKDGYVVRTNHWISDVMKGLDKKEDPYFCERLEAGIQWFEEQKKYTKVHVDHMFQWLGYVYQSRQNDPASGPGNCMVAQPKATTYWFTYGWPGGNLPPTELKDRQICQDMTWGVWIPFYLPELPPGQYTTELGQLTPLAIQYLFSHFSWDLQRSPGWYKYQSVDPLKPFYKPAEDVASPDGYAPKPNPYGPGGRVGTWTREDGFVPLESEE